MQYKYPLGITNINLMLVPAQHQEINSGYDKQQNFVEVFYIRP